MTPHYDTVVVGSGPGGCVVARRLADDGQRVALIEAASPSPLPTSLQGLSAVGDSASTDALTWPGVSTRYGESSPAVPYSQGRALGGSSAINSMVLSPGDVADYSDWQTKFGCDAWGPKEMRPWLDEAMAALPVQYVSPGPVTEAVMGRLSPGTAQQPRGLTSLDLDALGLVDAALAAKNNNRYTAFKALVSDQIGRADSTVELFADTTIDRVVVNGGVATGVETDQGQTIEADAVVLAAGAVGTPRIVARSIPDIHGLGQRIVDHPSFSFAVRSRTHGESSAGQAVEVVAAVSQVLRLSSGSSLRPGDIQVLVIENVLAGNSELSVVVVTLLTPNSHGRMAKLSELKSDIQRGCLTSVDDRMRFRLGVRQIAKHLVAGISGGPIAEVLIDDKGTPASNLLKMTGDELDRWLVGHPGPVAHLCGACRMGPSPAQGAVTSSRPDRAGQVFGTSRLYVADSSVLPGLTSGGLQIPVMAVAARVAAGILNR